MRKSFRCLAITLGILGTTPMMAYADLGIESTDTKSISYSIYANTVAAGSEGDSKEDLSVETNVETTLQLNTKEPCLIFYKHDVADAQEIFFAKDGKVKYSYYNKGLLKEHPVEDGKITGVIYLKPAQEMGVDVSFKLYAQNHSNYVTIEEKTGKPCLVGLHLADKNGESERDILIFVKDGKADQDLFWYVDSKDIKAEIIGVIPLQEVSAEDYTITVDEWSISDDVISEWASYTSEAEIDFKDAVSGILVCGYDDTNEVQQKYLIDTQKEYYSINKKLPEEVIEQVYIEDDDILMEKVVAAMPEGQPKINIYGIAELDEKNEITVHSEAKETYEDILKKAEMVNIMTDEGDYYTSYDSYLTARGETEIETESETEAMTKAETESETEVITEAETKSETEVVTEAETETEVITEAETETEQMTEAGNIYKDRETVRKVQQRLNEVGYGYLSEDGMSGKRTKAAMHAYQKDKGLEISDDITEILLRELKLTELVSDTNDSATVKETETDAAKEQMTEVATKPDNIYKDRETVRKVQRRLNEVGYGYLSEDGVCGIRTMAAMHAYQKDKGLERSDDITESLLKELRIIK